MPPKKEDAKPAGPMRDPFVEVVFFLIACFALVYIVNALLSLLNGYNVSIPNVFLLITNFVGGNSETIWIIRIFLAALSILCIFVLIDLIIKLTKFRKEQHKLFYPDTPAESAEDTTFNPQWQQILNHIESVNENDWRQAVISADIMLQEILDKMNLPGDSIGDKLKAVIPGDFQTLNNAWEAHKIRNQIAHEGPQFILTHHTARETIANYEAVFKEFKII